MKKLIINYDNLDNFCKKNDFLLIDEEMLKKENMYKYFFYATDNNFVGFSVYPSNMPLIINKNVWKKLILINNELKEQGFCITIVDAYRPRIVQKIFWDTFYLKNGFHDELLVANPEKYGTHNIKINAIDMLLTNIDGSKVPLPCEFDDFSIKASINYECENKSVMENRDLLINTSKKYGLNVNVSEWWHFNDEEIQGMEYNYQNTNLIPIDDDETFYLQ